MLNSLFSLFKKPFIQIKVDNEAEALPYQLKTPEELLKPYESQITTISQLVGLSPEHFNEMYLKPLQAVANYVQLAPASELHHHNHPGGLLQHIIEVVTIALKLRREIYLPEGVEPERIEAVKDVWTYAVFVAALLHDIGKVVVDVQFSDGNISWNPLTQESPNFPRYQIVYNPNRKHNFHEQIPLLVIKKFVPMRFLSWVKAKESDAFIELIGFLSGNYESSPSLNELVQSADMRSTSGNIAQASDQTRSSKAAASTVKKALHERLLSNMRDIMANPPTKYNVPGAMVFTNETHAYVMSNKICKDTIARMRENGESGVPGKNDRIFDELQQFKVVEARQISETEAKASWRILIKIGTWEQKFSVLKFPIGKIWPKLDERPPVGETIIIELDKDDNPLETTNNQSPVSSTKKAEVKTLEQELPGETGAEKEEEKPATNQVSQSQAETSNVEIVAEGVNDNAIDDLGDFEDFMDVEEEPVPRSSQPEEPLASKENTSSQNEEQSSETSSENDPGTSNPILDDEEKMSLIVEAINEAPKASIAYHNSVANNQTYIGDVEWNNPDSPGATFMKWLITSLKDGTLITNRNGGLAHNIPEHGLFLVSPAIFSEFEKSFPSKDGKKAQKEIIQKKITMKNRSNGTNIFKARITKSNRIVNGMVISNPEAKLGIKFSSFNHEMIITEN